MGAGDALQLYRQQSDGCGCDALDSTGLTQGLGAQAQQLLFHFVADARQAVPGCEAIVQQPGESLVVEGSLACDFRPGAFDIAAVAQFSLDPEGDAAIEAGPVDILVNNAGCNVRKPVGDVTWDDWNTVLDTNLRGTFFMSQAIGRQMTARGSGRIITVGSITSVFGFGGLAPYTASRGGIRQLTMSLADAFGPQGVTVNCLAPGFFRTAQNDVMYRDEEWVGSIVARTPLRRPGQPGDLDGVVVFLASDASGYITGQTLLVDGGYTTGSTRMVPGKTD